MLQAKGQSLASGKTGNLEYGHAGNEMVRTKLWLSTDKSCLEAANSTRTNGPNENTCAWIVSEYQSKGPKKWFITVGTLERKAGGRGPVKNRLIFFFAHTSFPL